MIIIQIPVPSLTPVAVPVHSPVAVEPHFRWDEMADVHLETGVVLALSGSEHVGPDGGCKVVLPKADDLGRVLLFHADLLEGGHRKTVEDAPHHHLEVVAEPWHVAASLCPAFDHMMRSVLQGPREVRVLTHLRRTAPITQVQLMCCLAARVRRRTTKRSLIASVGGCEGGVS